MDSIQVILNSLASVISDEYILLYLWPIAQAN